MNSTRTKPFKGSYAGKGQTKRHALTTGYANAELQPDSGNIVYIENRKPIQRASDQTEDIKIIIEF